MSKMYCNAGLLHNSYMIWCMQLEFDMHVRMVSQKKWEHVGYHGNKSASIRLLDPLLPHKNVLLTKGMVLTVHIRHEHC